MTMAEFIVSPMTVAAADYERHLLPPTNNIMTANGHCVLLKIPNSMAIINKWGEHIDDWDGQINLVHTLELNSIYYSVSHASSASTPNSPLRDVWFLIAAVIAHLFAS